MHVYTCYCQYVYIHTYICTCEYIHVNMYICTLLPVCIDSDIYTCEYIHIYMHITVSTYTGTDTHTHTYVWVRGKKHWLFMTKAATTAVRCLSSLSPSAHGMVAGAGWSLHVSWECIKEKTPLRKLVLSKAAGDLSSLTLECKPICLQMLGVLTLLEWLQGGRCCLSLCIFVNFLFIFDWWNKSAFRPGEMTRS